MADKELDSLWEEEQLDTYLGEGDLPEYDCPQDRVDEDYNGGQPSYMENA